MEYNACLILEFLTDNVPSLTRILTLWHGQGHAAVITQISVHGTLRTIHNLNLQNPSQARLQEIRLDETWLLALAVFVNLHQSHYSSRTRADLRKTFGEKDEKMLPSKQIGIRVSNQARNLDLITGSDKYVFSKLLPDDHRMSLFLEHPHALDNA
uniref:Uncharacterized protein n=1 Tax=Romanomermis culicivorax TaxID=13658 RepID=A0A915HM34_ROMCU